MGQPFRITSSAGEDLLFKSMDLSEELGRLFNCRLELLSQKEDIDLEKLLGSDITVEIDLPEDRGTRYIHGYVSKMAHTGRSGAYVTYSATLRPWFWFLTRAADCRIFQQMTVPDIIKKVFNDRGFSDYKASLNATYRKWEYCVQYRETDFNFLSRLMEQEGIYYFFEYEDGKHTLVLADALGAHHSLPEYAEIPYYPPSENANREEHVFEWALKKSVRTGKFSSTAYYFVEPKLNLSVTESISAAHPHAEYEFFDYPGEYYKKSEGDRYALVHMEEMAARHERVSGQTDARGLFPGGLFTLKNYPREDQNREYLIVSTHHHLSVGGYEAGSDDDDVEYTCDFEAMPSAVPFRSERLTRKPAMQGPQTAMVVGKSGEEIDTDEYGRVKVQFKWDRQGKKDDNSSCWVRVAQVWAGGQWGGMAIPRIGQEVVVDFIEGDPDRPIVTGRVYNADNMPPYALPANKTRSTIKSRSTKGGDAENFNEIRFEDKKGEEEMYLHAEKDQNVVVEHDQTIHVENNRDKKVDVDQTEHVGNNKKINVVKNHTETVGGNVDIAIRGSKSESVSKNSSETVTIARVLSVGAAYQVSVGAAMNETVGAAKSCEVGGMLSETVGAIKSVSVAGNSSEDVGGNKSVNIGKDRGDKVAGKQEVTVKKEYLLKADKIHLTAENEIIFKAGKAQIILKKNGDIEISGANVTAKGSGKINIKASGDMTLKGSKITEN